MKKIQDILDYFPGDCLSPQVESLGSAGGFSGALLWKIHAPRSLLCLRRWPREHPSHKRLDFIHGLLGHVATNGCPIVPVPIHLRSSTPSTFLKQDGYLWELAPWMPGEATYEQNPSTEKLCNAARALASFHHASSDYRRPTVSSGPAPGVCERLEKTSIWRQEDLERIDAKIKTTSTLSSPIGGGQSRMILNYAKNTIEAVERELSALSTLDVPIQSCIRDVWEQHLLFSGDEVTGIVDFGAARPDTVVVDIARLLGSLAMNDQQLWKIGLQAYESLRPLSSAERSLLPALDRSAILLSGLNWLRWIFLENRNFSNWSAVTLRLNKIIARIENS
ncbi:MAG: phosphotransferase [Pirellulales bacterium]|nr:phosphotransferase [Pirellulales bacterium]